MYDVIIIGGGPAGLSAGIYAARGGLKTVIVESGATGGQAATTPEVENYPGVERTDGFALTATMQKQCADFGVEFAYDEVEGIKADGAIKSILLSSGDRIEGKTLIVATGAKPRKLGLTDEDKYIGAGISYCATCDGAFFKGKPVAVIGGGNTAAEDALYLEKFASKVYLIHRRDELRADKTLANRIKNSGIITVWNSVVTKLIGDTKLAQIEVKNIKTDSLTSYSVNGVFVAIGQTPSSDRLNFLPLNDAGYVVTDENMCTPLRGVFVAGDIRAKQLRQIVTAAADGAIAADSAIKYLSNLE